MIPHVIPAQISLFLLAAHFLRYGHLGLSLTCILCNGLMVLRKGWIVKILSVILSAAGFFWCWIAVSLIQLRIENGSSWGRLAMILSFVLLWTLWSAWLLSHPTVTARYSSRNESTVIVSIVFFSTFFLLSLIHTTVTKFPLLLVERFFPGFGWVEILIVSTYAAWLAEKLAQPKSTRKVRANIWLFFSIVFFSQLLLGLFVHAKFLMSGSLHFPVPALIIAGPLYRGESSFMLFLYLGTILLVGPAWCSYLCYFGAWDHLACKTQKRPKKPLPHRVWIVRVVIALVIFGGAYLFNKLTIEPYFAGLLVLLFAAGAVITMVVLSRKTGIMSHCIMYCPIGLLTDILGKINPFRIRISDRCTQCGVCSALCRYDCLNEGDITNKKPGLNCTLCGDCIGFCHENALQYHFGPIKGEKARSLFIATIVIIHATFLATARL